MVETTVKWGVFIDKMYGGDYSLGINIASENVNGEKAFYIYINLIFINVSIGRVPY